MTQQINLYDDRLRPRKELATARNLGISTAILLALVSALVIYARISADRHSAGLATVQAEVRTAQERMTALAKSLAERQVSPALAGELLKSRTLLQMRQEVMEVLVSGRIGNAEGFSGLMSGFARQAQMDVWLTGFVIAGGGEEIEIRGRMLDPAKLPGYVQRLSSEPVFHGRRFATLDMRSIEPEALKPDSIAGSPVTPTPLPLRYVEFVLRSANAPASGLKDSGSPAGGAQ